MTEHRQLTLVMVLPLCLAACAELESAHKSQQFANYVQQLRVVTEPCLRQPKDDSAYLLKTCEYVVATKLEVTAHPNTWTVTKIDDEIVDGKLTTAVHFSCCGPGDVAFFDKNTGQVCAYARKRW